MLLVTPSADFFSEPHVESLIGYGKVFHAAGISWTLSTHASEAGNFGMFIGNYEQLRMIALRIREAALELGVKRIVVGECGHAWRVAYSFWNTLIGVGAGGKDPFAIELQNQLDRLLLTYTEQYPDVVRTRMQMQDIQRQLKDEQDRRSTAVASGQTSITVTCAACTATTHVVAVIRNATSNNVGIRAVIPGSGSFVVHVTGDPGASTAIIGVQITQPGSGT